MAQPPISLTDLQNIQSASRCPPLNFLDLNTKWQYMLSEANPRVACAAQDAQVYCGRLA
jgi:hypothetical protein